MTPQGSGWQEVFLGNSADAEERLHDFDDEIHAIQFDAAGTGNLVPRCFHAKTQLSARGVFSVAEDVPEDLRIGFFQPGAEFPADVRISNGSVNIRADVVPDLRGIAVRVYTGDQGSPNLLSGETATYQDYLGINTPSAFSSFGYAFVGLMRSFHASHRPDLLERLLVEPAAKLPPVGRPLTLPDYLRLPDAVRRVRRFAHYLREVEPAPERPWKTAIGIIKTLSRRISRPPASLAGETYWGQAPFKWGPLAVEYKFKPRDFVGRKRGSGEGYLAEDLRERVKAGPIRFDFLLARFVDEERTPIEDAAKQWDSEYVRVADLVILQSPSVDDEAGRRAREEIDTIEFSPWNATDDFRPLGSLNRSRKRVYQASAAMRDTICPAGFD